MKLFTFTSMLVGAAASVTSTRAFLIWEDSSAGLSREPSAAKPHCSQCLAPRPGQSIVYTYTNRPALPRPKALSLNATQKRSFRLNLLCIQTLFISFFIHWRKLRCGKNLFKRIHVLKAFSSPSSLECTTICDVFGASLEPHIRKWRKMAHTHEVVRWHQFPPNRMRHA